MRSLFEQAIGKRISFLASILVLMSSQLLHAQDDLKTQTLVSTLTGGVHILSVDEKGIIDSTGILELVSFIEEDFGIAVEDEELIPENLDSIKNVVAYLERKV